MRTTFLLLILVVLTFSCKEKNNATTMLLNGDIKGLKKGTLYLQKIQDTTLFTIDSLKIDGNSNFTFKTTVESPEIFYLYLNKKDGNTLDDRITFFGEPGVITIKTSREFFEADAKITGSKTNKIYEKFLKGKERYSHTHLNLLKTSLETQKDDIAKIDSINKAIERNTLRSYLYIINFALNNRNSQVAPYVVLSQAYDMQLKYLDTINNALTPEVAKSKYGIMLADFIKDTKAESK